MNFMSIQLGVFLIGSAKSYAMLHFKNEDFLSTAISFGSIFGACRFFWSFLLDKYSYKVVYGSLVSLQLLIGFTLPSVMAMPDCYAKNLLFFFEVCFIFNLEGGHFVLTPTILAKLFGPQNGIRVFSIGFSFIAIAAFVNILITSSPLFELLGFSGLTYLYTCFSSATLIILFFVFKERKFELK